LTMADLLVVDNDARIAELVAWFLERGGHSPRVVTSYAAAREALLEQSFALMLADLELGTEDGRVELPLLEDEGILPKTLVVSGYLDAEVTEALRQISGVVGTVPKPFEPAELLERVNELVASEPSAPEADAEEVDAAAVAPTEEAAAVAPTEEEDAPELKEVVIPVTPAPSVEEPRTPRETEVDEPVTSDDGWVEIVSEERSDPSDWEGLR